MRPLQSNAHLFDEQLGRTLYALVRVTSPPLKLHRGLAEFLQAAWPSLVGVLLIPERETRDLGWWNARFRSGVGPVRQQPGYFLFHAGTVIGHHPGHIRPSSVQFGSSSDLEAQRERVRRLGFLGSRRVSPQELEAARQLGVYFDELIELRQRAQSGYSWTEDYTQDSARQESPSGSSGRRSSTGSGDGSGGAKPAAPAPPDHYEVLGVTPSSTVAEVRKAYRQAMKMNHPDKVSHLSPALQKFAEAQVLAIQEAYSAIMDARRA